jgi:hypothetical protein
MINVRIRFFETPNIWIGGKLNFHIFMNEFLQIQVNGTAQSSNDDIRTDSLFQWHVTSGIGQADIGGIVTRRRPDLASRFTSD